MKNILAAVLQLVLFIGIAPFLSGLITKGKNDIRMRKGQSVFQPYYHLAKLFAKGEVVSETASWIFKAAPFVVIASTLTACLLIPLNGLNSCAHLGDFLALIFIFALGRFFLALAALDTGSAFGGMGSSREMFISSLAEPAACLAIFSLALRFGSTHIAAFSGWHPVYISSVLTALVLFLLALAETSRIPVDNQETHLELTMVHEAMVLEYSGKRLALIELASYVKQMIWLSLIALVIFPDTANFYTNIPSWSAGLIGAVARLIVIAMIVAVTEISLAKMRLFRVPDFLVFAFVLGIMASVCAIIGV